MEATYTENMEVDDGNKAMDVDAVPVPEDNKSMDLVTYPMFKHA